MIDLSICIISYNQEQFIAEAIESALSQQVTFENEIIICDDCSTDNTAKIIQSYEERYPGKVKAVFAEKNNGMLKNWEKVLKNWEKFDRIDNSLEANRKNTEIRRFSLSVLTK